MKNIISKSLAAVHTHTHTHTDSFNEIKNNKEKYKNKSYLSIKNNGGITLVALVVTIVILIILATVAINLSLENNGVFNRAKTAKEQYSNAQDYEKTEIAKASNEIDGYVDGNRDTVTVPKDEYENLKNSVQELSNKSPVGFINTNQLLVDITDFTDGTTYTATDNCAVLVNTYGNANRQGVYVKINNVVVWHCFDNNGQTQFTNTIYLKKGQTLTFEKDVALPGNEHTYAVYKLDC